MIAKLTNNKLVRNFVPQTVALFAIAGLGISVLPHPVQAASTTQVIQLRSGQVSGNPGTAGQTDTNITYWTKGLDSIPLSPTAFTSTDFDKARGIGCTTSGSNPDICGPAKVINPISAWIPNLPSDPSARWINWSENFTVGLPAASVLYAYAFTVAPGTINNASIDFYWSMDDLWGESYPGYVGPNPIGLYLNGSPFNSNFTTQSGEGYNTESFRSQSGIQSLLLPGVTNWLYVYQRDAGAAVSGSIFSAKISINIPEPSSIYGLTVLGILGTASVLKRQTRSVKSTRSETPKV